MCKAALEHHGQSRPLPKHQASQYGLQESDVGPEARVCSACRCRVVRRRYVQCPLPTCPTSKRRVKRLRPLPNKWNEIPADIRSALETEFQVLSLFLFERTLLTHCCVFVFQTRSPRI